ncbi:MAG: hypothetical protein J7L15_07280 [Clostridiales bacterium]|nr:hypothetical protein [Clostridiales bacterium]
MAYVKKKEKEQLLLLLDIVSQDRNWKELDRKNICGSGLIYFDDFLKIDKRWREMAKKLKKEL